MWLALALALLVPLSSGAGYADAQGDTVVAPDVARVRVANDDDGVVTWRIDVANRRSLERRDRYTLRLDVDLDARNGSLGAEYAIVVDGARRTVALARFSGRWHAAFPQETVRARWRDGLVLSVNRSEIGRPEQLDFSLVASSDGELDWAPDRGDWRYGLIVSPS